MKFAVLNRVTVKQRSSWRDSLFCKVDDFKEAISSCIELLDFDALRRRGINILDIDEVSRVQLNNLIGFLSWVKEKVETSVDSYPRLVEELQKSEVPEDYKILVGFLGKIFDAVQVIKSCTLRNKQVKNAIRKCLERTGHDFLLSEINEDLRKKFLEELLNATATFLLLEVVFSFSNSANPISSLRRNMRDRLPEEYFSELLAGWLVEEVIFSELEKKGISIIRHGVDKERKILFRRSKNMGEYDLIFSLRNAQDDGSFDFKLEIQRVGKKKIPLDREKKAYKVDLKSHKEKFLKEENNSVLLLWIGEGKFRIEEGKKTITPRKGEKPSYLLFISNEDFSKLEYNKSAKKLFIDPEFLRKNAIEWKRFKRMTKEDFIRSLGI